jgi:hypothetical protein
MKVMRAVIVVATLVSAAGCADGGGQLTSASPVAVVIPSVPSSCAVPGVPSNVSAEVTGASVSLSWSAVGDATDYVVLVGGTPVSSETVLTNTSEAHHSIESIPTGTHFARVHAHNWCGTSEASQAVAFSVESSGQ